MTTNSDSPYAMTERQVRSYIKSTLASQQGKLLDDALKNIEDEMVRLVAIAIEMRLKPSTREQKVSDTVRDTIIRSVWQWKDGWRFCDDKYSPAFDDEVRKMHIEKFGSPPIGMVVYSDDCACQIDGRELAQGTEHPCECACHTKAREFADVVIAGLELTEYV